MEYGPLRMSTSDRANWVIDVDVRRSIFLDLNIIL